MAGRGIKPKITLNDGEHTFPRLAGLVALVSSRISIP